MVTNFSIDREKTTSKSYTASLTFQFDVTQVRAWALGSTLPEEGGHPLLPSLKGNELKVNVSFASLSEWHRIKKELDNTSGVLKVTLLSLSPKMASLNVTYADDLSKLQKLLKNQGWLLISQNEGWSLTRANLGSS